jgi:DNA replication protein DnaC
MAPTAECPYCHNVGYTKEAVPVGHPHFGVLFPCVCKQAVWHERQRDEQLRRSNLQAFPIMTFASFDPRSRGVRRAFLQAQEYAQQRQGWLSLFGPYGVGKTHLAVAIAHEALRCNQDVIVAIVPDLLDDLRATFAPQHDTTYDVHFDRIRNVSLLVLDDLGTESGTPWAREKLYQLVNHRYNRRLATVFTSNQAPEHLDGRMLSRMCDPAVGATVVRIEAADYRKRALVDGLV